MTYQKKTTKGYLLEMGLYATGGAVASIVLPLSAFTCALGGAGVYLYRTHQTINNLVNGTASGAWGLVSRLVPGSKTSPAETVSEYNRITERLKDDILRLEAAHQLDQKETLDKRVMDVDEELDKLKKELGEKRNI